MKTEADIVNWMTEWLSNRQYVIAGELGETRVTDIIDSSLDVVELTMDLEEALEHGDDDIDLEELAPKFATLTFNDLSREILRRVA